MDERLQRLNEKAKTLPKTPGVYLMKDAAGRVIYVGKATSLRDRVGSYFVPSTKLEFKKAGLLDQVVSFDTIDTDSEVEALLAENRLIKDIQPRFNARLLDDKTFPVLDGHGRRRIPRRLCDPQPRRQGRPPVRAFHERLPAQGGDQPPSAGVQVPHLRVGDPRRRRQAAVLSALPAPRDQAVHRPVRRPHRQGKLPPGHHQAAAFPGRRPRESAAGP